MARDDPYFRLRIPEELKARVEVAAERNKRSMTAEILALLEAAFAADETIKAQGERIDELETLAGKHDARLEALEDRVNWLDGTAIRSA